MKKFLMILLVFGTFFVSNISVYAEGEDSMNTNQGGYVSNVPVPEVSDDPSCVGLMGTQMTKVTNDAFAFVQYSGPVLIAILTVVDLIKAVASGDSGDISKAQKRLVKRCIAGIALFFVPLICNMLFSIAGITVPDSCIG